MVSIDLDMTAEQVEAKAFYSRSTVSYCACEPTDETIHSLGGWKNVNMAVEALS